MSYTCFHYIQSGPCTRAAVLKPLPRWHAGLFGVAPGASLLQCLSGSGLPAPAKLWFLLPVFWKSKSLYSGAFATCLLWLLGLATLKEAPLCSKEILRRRLDPACWSAERLCPFLNSEYFLCFSSGDTKCFELSRNHLFSFVISETERWIGVTYAYNPFSRQNSGSE